jgi:hypothetical protein
VEFDCKLCDTERLGEEEERGEGSFVRWDESELDLKASFYCLLSNGW